jgi:hypothetical protein
MPWENIRFVEKGLSYKLCRRLIGLLIRSSCVLNKIQSDLSADNPPSIHIVFSRNASDINFEMVICCRRNFGKALFNWKLKGLVPLLIVEND